MYRCLPSNRFHSLFLCTVLLLPLACNKQASGERTFVGSWKASSGATFSFNADKTATVNGKPATWTEDKGIISLKITGRDTPMRITADISQDGKFLSMRHAWATLPPMEFKKQ